MTSLSFPILDYCCLVYNDLSDELNTKLQQLMNCGIHFIFHLRQDVHISPYRRSLGWLTVRSRRLYFLGIATFNILQGSSPSYVRDLFNRSAPSDWLSRYLSPNVFAIPYFRTSTFRNSFYLSAIYFWHSLPDAIRSSPTVRILKGRLVRLPRTQLLRHYFICIFILSFFSQFLFLTAYSILSCF